MTTTNASASASTRLEATLKQTVLSGWLARNPGFLNPKAGREISAANLAELGDLLDLCTEIAQQCSDLKDGLNAFVSRVEPMQMSQPRQRSAYSDMPMQPGQTGQGQTNPASQGQPCDVTIAQPINKDRVITFCCYRFDEPDRDGETIVPGGWGARIGSYTSNPIVSFGHNTYDALPVGKACRVWSVMSGADAGLWADLEFARADANPEADFVFKLYKGGFLNAVSIAALPWGYSFEPCFPDQSGLSYTDVELLDISTVVLPSNRGALAVRQALAPFKAKGKVTDRDEVLLSLWLGVDKVKRGQKLYKMGFVSRPMSEDQLKRRLA